jgi:hypothetical protein
VGSCLPQCWETGSQNVRIDLTQLFEAQRRH